MSVTNRGDITSSTSLRLFVLRDVEVDKLHVTRDETAQTL